MINPYSNPT